LRVPVMPAEPSSPPVFALCENCVTDASTTLPTIARPTVAVWPIEAAGGAAHCRPGPSSSSPRVYLQVILTGADFLFMFVEPLLANRVSV
jgi:hypothetical protein